MGMTERSAPLTRLLAEDVDAGFERIVREHAAAVVTLARRLSGPAGDDVAQEAFTRALRAMRAMPADELATLRVRPWLLTITRNTAYNHHRTRRRRPHVVGEPAAEVRSDAEAPDTALERQETGDDLRAALDRLPTPQRDAIVLRHVLDLSSRDAAEILGWNENTLKSHLARGLRRLRDELERPDATPDPPHPRTEEQLR
jgi:RNA polymerase sigma-70 factor (ECF subfamily)